MVQCTKQKVNTLQCFTKQNQANSLQCSTHTKKTKSSHCVDIQKENKLKLFYYFCPTTKHKVKVKPFHCSTKKAK